MMDNASYNCVQLNKNPTAVTLKSDNDVAYRQQCCFWGEYAKGGITWFTEEGAEWKNYWIDKMIKAQGHDVLHIPHTMRI